MGTRSPANPEKRGSRKTGVPQHFTKEFSPGLFAELLEAGHREVIQVQPCFHGPGILRVENLIERAKVSADIRAELQGLKLLTFVQGLHHVKSGDMMEEMIKIMKQTGDKFEIESKPQEIIVEAEGKLLDVPEEEQ